MIHSLHGAVVHARHAFVGHAHVGHGQQGPAIERRRLGRHLRSRGQGAAPKRRPPHGGGEDGKGTVFPGPDDHVVGFRHGNAELIYLDGLHIIPIGVDYQHLQTWNADIEIGHGG